MFKCGFQGSFFQDGTPIKQTCLTYFGSTKGKEAGCTSCDFHFHFRYYHDHRNFTRLLTMLSNEVVARARQLVGEHVLENLLAVSEFSLLPLPNYTFSAVFICSKTL